MEVCLASGAFHVQERDTAGSGTLSSFLAIPKHAFRMPSCLWHVSGTYWALLLPWHAGGLLLLSPRLTDGLTD